ncbi:MAG: hypothetical protein IPM82_19010 [Saprospiraceae bacterium]|nr:hypothetical protein [Saprospiraceae bacterium]
MKRLDAPHLRWMYLYLFWQCGFVTSETGITNANYAVGASDASFAELYDNSDQIVLYLEDELASVQR